MGETIKVAKTGEVPEGGGIAVEAAGRTIALFCVEGKYYAIDDTCTHRGGPLSEGEVEGTQVTCPWHGASFELTSGAVLGPPAPSGVACYKVEVKGEDIQIELP